MPADFTILGLFDYDSDALSIYVDGQRLGKNPDVDFAYFNDCILDSDVGGFYFLSYKVIIFKKRRTLLL